MRRWRELKMGNGLSVPFGPLWPEIGNPEWQRCCSAGSRHTPSAFGMEGEMARMRPTASTSDCDEKET